MTPAHPPERAGDTRTLIEELCENIGRWSVDVAKTGELAPDSALADVLRRVTTALAAPPVAAPPREAEGVSEGDVFDEARAERVRAHAKHGEKSMEAAPVDAPKRLSILVEEVGEVAKEFNDAAIDDRPVDLARLRKELLQVTAMAGAWADRCAPNSAALRARHETTEDEEISKSAESRTLQHRASMLEQSNDSSRDTPASEGATPTSDATTEPAFEDEALTPAEWLWEYAPPRVLAWMRDQLARAARSAWEAGR